MFQRVKFEAKRGYYVSLKLEIPACHHGSFSGKGGAYLLVIDYLIDEFSRKEVI